MINLDFRTYPFYKYGDKNAYAQRVLEKTPQGTINMAIYTTSQSIQDNINYKGATYLGLTYYTALLDDLTAIEYEGKKLKVLYVNPKGRLTQVFMAEI